MAQCLYTRALDHFISFLAVKDRIIYVGLAFVLIELFSKRLLKIKIENLGMPKFSIKAKWIIIGVLLPVTVIAVYLFFFSGKYVSSGMNSNQIFSILSAGIAFTGIAREFDTPFHN